MPTLHLIDGQARLAPFSLRLTAEERARLERDAEGQPLGAYIKSRVFGADAPTRAARRPLPVRDQRTIAQALAQLGRSELAASLRELADAARSGSLDCSDDLAEMLAAGCADIRAIRLMLVTALGLKRATPAPATPAPRQAFCTVADGSEAR